jgi:flagellar motor switch protein FliN/FliY
MSEHTPETQSDDNIDDWAAAMAEQSQEQSHTMDDDDLVDSSKGKRGDNNYKRAAFKNLHNQSGQLTTTDANLDVILDIPVTLSMEIGRTEIPIYNLLQLNQGSVVELDRLAGEPMDVLINGTLIAHGEVVVINEKFGIRLTDVISPAERVKKLK